MNGPIYEDLQNWQWDQRAGDFRHRLTGKLQNALDGGNGRGESLPGEEPGPGAEGPELQAGEKPMNADEDQTPENGGCNTIACPENLQPEGYSGAEEGKEEEPPDSQEPYQGKARTAEERARELYGDPPKRGPGRPRGKYKAHKKPHSPNFRSGLYSLTKVKPGEIDGRTRLGQAIRELRRELEEDLGGKDCLSAQQKVLLQRVVFKVLRLSSFESFALQHAEEGDKGYLGRDYISLSNSLRLDLQALGLERRERDITPLKDRLAALQNEEGNEEETKAD